MRPLTRRVRAGAHPRSSLLCTRAGQRPAHHGKVASGMASLQDRRRRVDAVSAVARSGRQGGPPRSDSSVPSDTRRGANVRHGGCAAHGEAPHRVFCAPVRLDNRKRDAQHAGPRCPQWPATSRLVRCAASIGMARHASRGGGMHVVMCGAASMHVLLRCSWACSCEDRGRDASSFLPGALFIGLDDAGGSTEGSPDAAAAILAGQQARLQQPSALQLFAMDLLVTDTEDGRVALQMEPCADDILESVHSQIQVCNADCPPCSAGHPSLMVLSSLQHQHGAY